jgi:hypothetical protein
VADKYVAIPYEWGTASEPRFIRVDGTPFHVQPNLWAALQAVRKTGSVLTVYVDGICINPSDIAECNQQIAMMAQLYRNAECVLIRLGPAGEKRFGFRLSRFPSNCPLSRRTQ